MTQRLATIALLSLPAALMAAAPAHAAEPTVPASQSTPATAPTAGARFTLDTPIATLVADAQAKAVIDKDLPGLASHPQFESFKSMSLKDLSGFAPDKLTPEVLGKVQTDLAALH
ncbi:MULTISPECIES: hypothetical protein [unclassified Novosphingobium]|uniref:hypothetical protein n=1 Tax=unclassified Novosphingobium TaxID=2644732 RepID=UPI00146EEFF2|nr:MULTISPECIES: hypothetical protein [unclassified Novosphingobium]NMN05804.1 hypothetical protein [Novosphingobium sp. SG919]NMN87836.1 hypothetical protein [Novosphingobium sp. SG916]